MTDKLDSRITVLEQQFLNLTESMNRIADSVNKTHEDLNQRFKELTTVILDFRDHRHRDYEDQIATLKRDTTEAFAATRSVELDVKADIKEIAFDVRNDVSSIKERTIKLESNVQHEKETDIAFRASVSDNIKWVSRGLIIGLLAIVGVLLKITLF